MGWTRQRVAILATVIFLAHVLAIFALHTPQPMVVLPDGFRVPKALPVAPATNDIVELDGINDPLVFAGAHQFGFSAAAWMMRPRADFALTNAPPAPRFLAFSRQASGFTQPEVFTRLQRAADLPFLQFNLPRPSAKSTLFVEGALENRPLVKALEVPIQRATDVLSNTVVQLAVRADGFPLSARIITTSGSRHADLTALNLANNSRFAALQGRDAEELQWGNLVFQWFTVEPTATNTAAK